VGQSPTGIKTQDLFKFGLRQTPRGKGGRGLLASVAKGADQTDEAEAEAPRPSLTHGYFTPVKFVSALSCKRGLNLVRYGGGGDFREAESVFHYPRARVMTVRTTAAIEEKAEEGDFSLLG
jgi:hypothetical protein